MHHMQQYTQFRIPTELHTRLKDLAHERRVSMTSLLAQAISLLDNEGRNAKPHKPIEQPTKPALTPQTKKPFIRPLVPTVPVHGDPSTDHYQPRWDDSETAS